MKRRGFLGAILAACAAPAIVRADSLMRIVPREATIVFPYAPRTTDLRAMVKVMKAQHIPPDKDGFYFALFSSDGSAFLSTETGYESYSRQAVRRGVKGWNHG